MGLCRNTLRTLGAALIIGLGFISGVSAQSGTPIRIGMSLALTGAGASPSKVISTALEIWRDDVNAKGGLLGRPVELVIYDDQSAPANVPNIYTKLGGQRAFSADAQPLQAHTEPWSGDRNAEALEELLAKLHLRHFRMRRDEPNEEAFRLGVNPPVVPGTPAVPKSFHAQLFESLLVSVELDAAEWHSILGAKPSSGQAGTFESLQPLRDLVSSIHHQQAVSAVSGIPLPQAPSSVYLIGMSFPELEGGSSK